MVTVIRGKTMFRSTTSITSGVVSPPVLVLGDNDFEYTTLLLKTNGVDTSNNNTFVDSSTNNFTITRNGNVTQGSYSPYRNEWSVYFDGTDDYIQIADNAALEIVSSDFTIEFWINLENWPNLTSIATKGWSESGIYGSWLFYARSTQNIEFYASSSGSSWDIASAVTINGGVTIESNQWHHVVVCREGGTLSTYFNGVRTHTSTPGATQFHDNTSPITLMADNNGNPTGSGYMADFNYVIGSSIYDPTSTTLTVPTNKINSTANTQLLVCQSNRFVDISTNNFTVTPANGPIISPLSPYIPSTNYDAATIGGSAYFDGTGDYITFPSPFSGTGDFTVEAWVYKESLSAAKVVVATSRNSSPTAGFLLSIDATTGNPYLFSYVTGGRIVTATSGINAKEWAHVAAVRQSGTVTMYVNGVAAGTASDTSNYTTSTNGAVGATSDGAAPFDGYITDARVVTSAVYTSNFTPPTAPLTAVSGASFLCNFDNAGIYDVTGKNVVETVNGAQVDTTTVKYGSGAMEFDGVNDYLSYNLDERNKLGSGDFTFETWVYRNTTDNATIYTSRDGNNRTGPVFDIWDNKLGIVISNDGIDWQVNTLVPTYGADIPVNQWSHLAVVRSGTTIYAFIDGQQQYTRTFTGSVYETTSKAYISYDPGIAGMEFSGFMEDFRITKGVARYTANFTPPAAELPPPYIEQQDTPTQNFTWNTPDLSTGSYDSVSIATGSGFPEDLYFKPDGTELYIVQDDGGAASANVKQFTMTTPWDLSTASLTKTGNVGVANDYPADFVIENDGTKLYLVRDGSGGQIDEYNMTTAWDASTLTFVRTYVPNDTNTRSIWFHSDGSKMLALSTSENQIEEYSLSTPYDISTLSLTGVSFSTANEAAGPIDIFLSETGLDMLILDITNTTVYQYVLSTAFDISTASYTGKSIGVGTQESSPRGVAFKDDGSKMYVTGATTDNLYQYSVAAA